MTRRVGVEGMIRKELAAYFGPDGTDDDDLDALFLRLLRRELAKERGRVRRIVKARKTHYRQMPIQAHLVGYQWAVDDILTALSGRKGRR